jgi:hypothetical protein
MRPYRTGAEHFAHPYARRGQRKSQKNNPSRFSFTMSGRGPQPKFFTKCGNIGTRQVLVENAARESVEMKADTWVIYSIHF